MISYGQTSFHEICVSDGHPILHSLLHILFNRRNKYILSWLYHEFSSGFVLIMLLPKTAGHLSYLVWLSPHLILSRMALSYMELPPHPPPPIYTYNCSQHLVVLGLHSVHGEWHICAKCKTDIHIYWKIMICWNLPLNKRQSKKREAQARQDKRGGTPTKSCTPVLKNIFPHTLPTTVEKLLVFWSEICGIPCKVDNCYILRGMLRTLFSYLSNLVAICGLPYSH